MAGDFRDVENLTVRPSSCGVLPGTCSEKGPSVAVFCSLRKAPTPLATFIVF